MDQNLLLITAAYNERDTISKLIESVLKQSIKPLRWIIVDDGSTDTTAEIVHEYQQKHSFIQLEQVKAEEKQHSFSAKVHALNLAISKLDLSQAEFIGILDADIELPDNYFSVLLDRMNNDSSLGIAGGVILPFYDGFSHPSERRRDCDSVAGAVQMFKKKCFLDIGSQFLMLPFGGEDSAMEIIARAKGWITKTFWDIEVTHFGSIGSAIDSSSTFRFRKGITNFCLGYGFLFFSTRLLYRVKDTPFFIGSVIELAGFIYARFLYKKPFLPKPIIRKLRRIQRNRILSLTRIPYKK